MSALMLETAVWGTALIGLFLAIYTFMKWRRAARACHPMPFRRRKGYITALAFSTVVFAAPAAVQVNATMASAPSSVHRAV